MGFVSMWIKLAILAFVIRLTFITIQFLDPFRIVYNQRPGACEIVPGIEDGSEDIVMTPDGTAFISSGLPPFLNMPQEKWTKGKIYTYKDRKLTTLKITGHDLTNFMPHGISVFEDSSSGKTFVYVINHVSEEADLDTVEVFEYKQPDVLKYVKSITSELFTFMNNLKVLAKDKFYITKIMHFRKGILQGVEMFLHLAYGGVIYFDGENAKEVVGSLWSPNGVDVSRDKKILYVTSSKDFMTYQIKDDNGLAEIQKFDIGSVEDNINVDADSGDVWLAGHPIAYKLIMHMAREISEPAPSHVLRLKVKDGYVISVEQIFADDGNVLSASSVALHNQGSLLIGTVYRKLMHCEVNA